MCVCVCVCVVLSSADSLFRCISSLQCGRIRKMFYPEVNLPSSAWTKEFFYIHAINQWSPYTEELCIYSYVVAVHFPLEIKILLKSSLDSAYSLAALSYFLCVYIPNPSTMSRLWYKFIFPWSKAACLIMVKEPSYSRYLLALRWKMDRFMPLLNSLTWCEKQTEPIQDLMSFLHFYDNNRYS